MHRQFTIKNFVRHVLGCTCPDKVFERIENCLPAPSAAPHTRCITVGDRLLIYIWKVQAADKLRENLFAMLEAGRKQRDEKGLNRFRAVLAVEGSLPPIEIEAKSYFAQYAGKDDRMHIHVISAADLKGL